ncbi:hypothetical protein GCM10010156_64450 [Planobispora rosea]|uniref:Uncharacterized protein n=1 Tax=Planobispora rosea TaxID=35762 RepID=A0A8J3S7T3_PLARO|nr:hypothetical protein GCM10010156_64450 [Planobispora rosea]GIH87685.1 hypothetical protein Pro02_60930 [Planobispora rosea]
MPQITSLSPLPPLHALVNPWVICAGRSAIDVVGVGEGAGDGTVDEVDEGMGEGLGDSENTERIPPGSARSAAGQFIDRTHIADRAGRRHITPGKTGTSGPGAAGGES